jgi:hypothetical protein
VHESRVYFRRASPSCLFTNGRMCKPLAGDNSPPSTSIGDGSKPRTIDLWVMSANHQRSLKNLRGAKSDVTFFAKNQLKIAMAPVLPSRSQGIGELPILPVRSATPADHGRFRIYQTLVRQLGPLPLPPDGSHRRSLLRGLGDLRLINARYWVKSQRTNVDKSAQACGRKPSGD